MVPIGRQKDWGVHPINEVHRLEYDRLRITCEQSHALQRQSDDAPYQHFDLLPSRHLHPRESQAPAGA